MFIRKSLESDVPVKSGIGWWSHQEHLSVRELLIRVLTPELHVASPDAEVEFTVSGRLSACYELRWRPFIECLHISERFAGESGKRIGDILIVPVVGLRVDKSYDHKPVEFRVTARHEISSYRWNRNRYRVTCEQIQQTFKIIQFNKDRVLHEEDEA